jgi:hypothetical protein
VTKELLSIFVIVGVIHSVGVRHDWEAVPALASLLLRTLSTVGGSDALQAVRAAVNDSNPDVHGAAIRALGAWKTADAAPDLLNLAHNASNPTDQMLCLRSWDEGVTKRAKALLQQAQRRAGSP